MLVQCQTVQLRADFCLDCTNPIPVTPEVEDLGDKLAVRVLMAAKAYHLITPAYDEWTGLNKMAKDGELNL